MPRRSPPRPVVLDYDLDNPPPKPYGSYTHFGFQSEQHRISVAMSNVDRHDHGRADERIKARTRAILGEYDA